MADSIDAHRSQHLRRGGGGAQPSIGLPVTSGICNLRLWLRADRPGRRSARQNSFAGSHEDWLNLNSHIPPDGNLCDRPTVHQPHIGLQPGYGNATI